MLTRKIEISWNLDTFNWEIEQKTGSEISLSNTKNITSKHFKMFYFLRHSDYEFNFVLFIQKSMKVSYFTEDYSILIYKLKFENNIRNTC